MEYIITETLKQLMACGSVTNTEREKKAEIWMLDFFSKLPYFQKYPEQCGLFPIPGDPFKRSSVWALVTTEEVTPDAPAVILMGHHDVVSADVYGEAEPWAFDMESITARLNEKMLSPEAYTDLLSGEWIFGRGSCDMLGGTAVQLAVLKKRAEAVLKKFGVEPLETNTDVETVPQEIHAEPEILPQGSNKDKGALLFLSVPDEESFSVGMRGTLPLLEKLKEEYCLDYRLAVCAEPNQRTADGRIQIIYSGSIGKLLPVVLVQGRTVQIGSCRDGVNPLGILSRIVAATEGDESFTEICEGEVSVPPVWMYARDLKEGYDFSLPYRAAGYCNVLTFRKTPAQVLAYFLGKIRVAVESAPQPVAVMTWVTPWQQAKQKEGFAPFWRKTEDRIRKMLQEQRKTYPEVTLWLMQATLDFLKTDKPLVLLGFAPPYYPPVRSEDMKNAAQFEIYKKAITTLQKVKIEPYFPGVSDCSYCGLSAGTAANAYQANTPLWGDVYHFDAEALERLQIPFFLFGPWGK
ncbi:MAG: hypothetical protein IKZ43_01535, partial [Acidaminococcaceae bacterium]|nr:hypothetical protein [Acidaminococcaceae bacterium]